MPSRSTSLVLFALGIGLVLNPVYLFPGGVPYDQQITYESELVDEVPESDVITSSGTVLECSDEVWHTQCVQARQVGYGGRRQVALDAAVRLPSEEYGLAIDYRFVKFPQGWARPNATLENGTLRLAYEPVATSTVLAAYAFPFDDLPAIGKRAIREGRASTVRRVPTRATDPLIPQELRLVERNGSFYRLSLEQKVEDRAFPSWLLGAARALGVVGGAVLAFVGARWHARAEGDPPTEGWDLRLRSDENE